MPWVINKPHAYPHHRNNRGEGRSHNRKDDNLIPMVCTSGSKLTWSDIRMSKPFSCPKDKPVIEQISRKKKITLFTINLMNNFITQKRTEALPPRGMSGQ